MTEEQHLRQKLMGRRIAARRDAIGLSQYALADKLSVSQGAITAWETGARVPRWPDLRKLAVALEAPAEWIIEPLVVDFGQLPSGSETPEDE